MLGNILCQRYGQTESQGQIAVALGEAVDLLLGFAAALGQKDLGILNGGGVQGGKAVGGVGPAEDLHHFFQLDLLVGQQLHKAGQRPRGHFCHSHSPFYCAAIRHRNCAAPPQGARFPRAGCTPHFLFETSKRKCAVHGGKEKMLYPNLHVSASLGKRIL